MFGHGLCYSYLLCVHVTSNLANPFPPELEWKPSISLERYPYMPADYCHSQGSKLQTMDGEFILIHGHDCQLRSQEILTENDAVKRVVG
jgi:hypothetical protein